MVAALAMAAMIGTVVLVLNRTADNNVETTLSDRLDVASATLRIGPNGELSELQTPDDAVDASTWIFDPAGRLVDAPRAGQRVKAKVESLSTVSSRTLVESHDRVYLASPVRNGAGDVTAVIVVTESMGPYETTRIAVLSVLAGLAVLVTGGSAAIAAWTMRRALGPVEEMATLATDWSEHDLEARFDGAAESDEISTLGRTLNVLLDRVAGALRNEQQLTSELAHELRTPLTAIRGEAELGLLAASDPTILGRFENVVGLVDRMNATVGTLLAVARGHAARGSAGLVDDVVSSVLAHRPGPDQLAWTVNVGPNLLVAAPTDLAARALAPLVDNAARFARSSINISAGAHDRVVEITVSDDGEGVGAGDVESIFDAGRRHADSDGAGLGLALSRRVARTLGGDVAVRSIASPTSLTLTLPRF